MSARKTGFTMVELAVAILILVVGIFGTLIAIGVSMQARQVSKSSESAAEFLKVKLEEYRGYDLDEVFDKVAAEDQFGESALPDVYGLKSVNGEFMVEILAEDEMPAIFACDTNADGVVNASDTFDLDGDGDPNEDDADSEKDEYATAPGRLIPIQITIRWAPVSERDSSGFRTLVAHTILYPSETE